MATYLFAWELGYGLGHLVNLRPLVAGLHARGHRVVLVLRELTRAKAVFPFGDLPLWQAPFKTRSTKAPGPAVSFVHILDEAGLGSAAELSALAEAWRNIFRSVDPDVIVFDHSPSALVAARGTRAKRVTLGTGFFCPLDESPLRCLQPWLRPDLAQLARDEAHVLAAVNEVLREWSDPPLDRLAQLYHPADEHVLATFPELDHYPDRTNARYRGAWSSGFGKPPEWPSVAGKKIYAYLKPFPELHALLDLLRRCGQPTIVYCDGIRQDVQRHFQSPSLRFENEPLDMSQVGRECDLAILNANHGTSVNLLLAGKPTLQIPIYVEQALLAEAIMRMGAGLGASPVKRQEIEQQLIRLLNDECPLDGARQFAAKYASYDPEREIAAIVDRLEELGHAAACG